MLSLLPILLLGRFVVGQQARAVEEQAPAADNDVIIRGGTILTVTHGKIENGSIYIHNGKIAAIGKTVTIPAGATVIDAAGKWVMPGIIDPHSHIALDDDVNEATSPVTPQVRPGSRRTAFLRRAAVHQVRQRGKSQASLRSAQRLGAVRYAVAPARPELLFA